jgi:hypothetical protein
MTTMLKPILHGRDHGCGGADPIPGICKNSYTSVQTDVFTYSPFGIPSFTEIDTWPRIVIPADQWNYHRLAGHGLWGSWHCQVFGAFDRVDLSAEGSSTLPDYNDGDDPVTDDSWTALAATGWAEDPGTGGAGSTDDLEFWMRIESEEPIAEVSVRGGVLKLEWTAAGDENPGDLWTGTYPIMNPDVAANAAITVGKLDHPGGTDVFLRGDAAWSNLVLEIEY